MTFRPTELKVMVFFALVGNYRLPQKNRLPSSWEPVRVAIGAATSQEWQDLASWKTQAGGTERGCF
jgi:hypothetical protein